MKKSYLDYAMSVIVARALPDRLQKLLGYQRGAYALGYVDDLRDPLDVLMGRKDSFASFAPSDANAG